MNFAQTLLLVPSVSQPVLDSVMDFNYSISDGALILTGHTACLTSGHGDVLETENV